MIHELKCWPNYFDAVESGEKTFEVRRDDRGFQKGDVLRLFRYDPTHGYYTAPGGGKFSRRVVEREVTWILTGGQFGIEPGYVVLGLRCDTSHHSGETKP